MASTGLKTAYRVPFLRVNLSRQGIVSTACFSNCNLSATGKATLPRAQAVYTVRDVYFIRNWIIIVATLPKSVPIKAAKTVACMIE